MVVAGSSTTTVVDERAIWAVIASREGSWYSQSGDSRLTDQIREVWCERIDRVDGGTRAIMEGEKW